MMPGYALTLALSQWERENVQTPVVPAGDTFNIIRSRDSFA